MTYLTKIAGYGAFAAAAFAVAVALLVTSPTQETQAAAGTAVLTNATQSATGVNTLTVTDGDIGAATDFILATINPASTGTARFTSGGGQSLVCFNGNACDTDAAVNGTIIVTITGTGTAGAVVLDVALTDAVDGLDGAAPDGEVLQLGYTQTAPAAQLQLVSTATGVPATPVVGATTSQAVLSAIVTTATGAGVTAGTGVTFQAVGVGVFQDTVTVANTVAAAAGGGAYDAAAAGNSGCNAGEGLQSCTAATETADDGEVIATAEPAGTGTASVTFEGAGVAGTTSITARVGATGPSAQLNINVFGPAANIEVARTGTGAAALSREYLRNVAAAGNAGNVVVTVTDAAGVPVVGAIPVFAVQSPNAASGPVTLAGGANGTIPSCAAGTNAFGLCNIVVTPSTTQGLNTVYVGVNAAASPLTTAANSKTIDFTVVGAAASVEIVDAPGTVAPLSSTQLTIAVKDAEGDPAPDGTVIALAATGTGVIIAPPVTGLGTVAGNVNPTLVAGNTDGLVEIVAIFGTLPTDQVTIQVSGAASGGGTPPASGDGTITGATLTPGQLSIGTGNGSLTDLGASAVAQGCTNPVLWLNNPAGGLIGFFPTATLSAPNVAANAAFGSGYNGGILVDCN